MKGPAKHGAIIYASDIKSLAAFYVDFLAMKIVRESAEFISLDIDGFNLIIHVPPVTLPQGERFSAVKLFFTVDSLQQARSEISKFGGKTYPGEWQNHLFKVCNVADPEGNMLQLREFKN